MISCFDTGFNCPIFHVLWLDKYILEKNVFKLGSRETFIFAILLVLAEKKFLIVSSIVSVSTFINFHIFINVFTFNLHLLHYWEYKYSRFNVKRKYFIKYVPIDGEARSHGLHLSCFWCTKQYYVMLVCSTFRKFQTFST